MISKLISSFGYFANPDIIIQNINYEILTFIEKENLIQLFTSMLFSFNLTNATNFFIIYDQCQDQILEIFDEFAEINNILVINLILLIRQISEQIFDTNFKNIYEKYIKNYTDNLD